MNPSRKQTVHQAFGGDIGPLDGPAGDAAAAIATDPGAAVEIEPVDADAFDHGEPDFTEAWDEPYEDHAYPVAFEARPAVRHVRRILFGATFFLAAAFAIGPTAWFFLWSPYAQDRPAAPIAAETAPPPPRGAAAPPVPTSLPAEPAAASAESTETDLSSPAVPGRPAITEAETRIPASPEDRPGELLRLDPNPPPAATQDFRNIAPTIAAPLGPRDRAAGRAAHPAPAVTGPPVTLSAQTSQAQDATASVSEGPPATAASDMADILLPFSSQAVSPPRAANPRAAEPAAAAPTLALKPPVGLPESGQPGSAAEAGSATVPAKSMRANRAEASPAPADSAAIDPAPPPLAQTEAPKVTTPRLAPRRIPPSRPARIDTALMPLRQIEACADATCGGPASLAFTQLLESAVTSQPVTGRQDAPAAAVLTSRPVSPAAVGAGEVSEAEPVDPPRVVPTDTLATLTPFETPAQARPFAPAVAVPVPDAFGPANLPLTIPGEEPGLLEIRDTPPPGAGYGRLPKPRPAGVAAPPNVERQAGRNAAAAEKARSSDRAAPARPERAAGREAAAAAPKAPARKRAAAPRKKAEPKAPTRAAAAPRRQRRFDAPAPGTRQRQRPARAASPAPKTTTTQQPEPERTPAKVLPPSLLPTRPAR